MKKNKFYFTLLIFNVVLSQTNNTYNLKVDLNSNEKTLNVKQIMKFKNSTLNDLNTIFLEDWSNSYKDNSTKLAERISNEYSRSFTFAKRMQRGFTEIKKLKSDQIKSWSRSTKDKDIIEVNLIKPLTQGESIEITIDYLIKLPDYKFTGHGYDGNNFYLEDWIIVFSNIENSNWNPQPNLNLRDQTINFSDYKIDLEIDKNFEVITNLNKSINEINETKKVAILSGINLKKVKIKVLEQNNYKSFYNNQNKIETDIFILSDEIDSQIKVNRVSNFITNYFSNKSNFNLLVSKSDYEENPFYGLNQLPSFLSPFSNKFLEEIVFLKAYIKSYLTENVLLNKRESNWIYKGLEIFLIDKYIEEYYPNVKFLGSIAGYKILKNYELSNLNFTELFVNYSEYVQRANIHQEDILSSDKLTKINYEISSPYHTGIGFLYLEEIIGDENFNSLVKKIISSTSSEESINVFEEYSEHEINWFIKDYIGSRQSIDLYLEKSNSQFKVLEKNNIKIPYSIGLFKNDNLIFKENFNSYGNLDLPDLEFDYIAINPINKLPEINRNNNWLINKRELKPLRLKFIGDLDNPKYNNIYYRPEISYNLYDGISPGINLLNRGLKNKPFTYEIFSQYASKTKSLVGSIDLKYQLNDEVSKNFSTIYNIQYKTNHYDENLRYHVFSPSITLNFRDNKNLRSNIIRSFSFSNYTVKKESFDNDQYLNEYSIYNLSHSYSEIDIIKYLRTSFNTQIAKNFGKINFSFDFRKLLDSNRQFQARVYFGKFLWNKNKESTYFNYNLSRSGDYLFTGNYLGRSEKEGVLSQQFIMAGGGFKSFFENPSTNNFILSSNLNFGIWKWFESYIDLGVLKNTNEKSRYFYGTGIRLNLVPDFFELYFPVSSNNGFELSQNNYSKKIRFIVSYNLESLGKLFSRRWL